MQYLNIFFNAFSNLMINMGETMRVVSGRILTEFTKMCFFLKYKCRDECSDQDMSIDESDVLLE
jgi:hypothetical protein